TAPWPSWPARHTAGCARGAFPFMPPAMWSCPRCVPVLQGPARAQQAHPDSLQRELVVPGIDEDGLEFGVLGQQLDLGPLAAPALDGDLVADARDDDLAVAGFLGALDGEQVAVEDAGVAHAHAAHPQQVVGRLGEEGRIDGIARLDMLL